MKDVVTIIASGPSAAKVDLARARGYVIGVNESAIAAPRVDAIVSMDRLWTEHRWDELVRRCGPTWLRRSAVQNVKDRWDGLTIFECDHLSSAFTCIPGRLNGTNSGACALNLAYQLLPRRVYLVGFDMARGPAGAYWHGPHKYPNASPGGGTSNGKYREWAGQFSLPARAFRAASIDVFNVNPKSAIDDFPKITPKQYEKQER